MERATGAVPELGELLAAVEDRALVLLGPPGSGKSTLLRRFELEVSEAALATRRIENTDLLIQLLLQAAVLASRARAGGGLAERWAARFPDCRP